MISGVYIITNSIDSRVYIGSSINIKERWAEHKRHLSSGIHINKHLQRFVNKYTLDVLEFSILENCLNTLEREQFYLDYYKNKFNVAENATAPMLGKKHSPDALKKISERSKGVNNPMYGKKRPAYIGERVRECSAGRIKSKEERLLRMINLPNRKEIVIKKDKNHIICFSISHAAYILKVSVNSVSKALKKNYLCKNHTVNINSEVFYRKDILFEHLDKFTDLLHPQPELINMLKSLQG